MRLEAVAVVVWLGVACSAPVSGPDGGGGGPSGGGSSVGGGNAQAGGSATGGGSAFDAGPPPVNGLDPTFGAGGCVEVNFGGPYDEFAAVAVAADGTIWAAGSAVAFDAGTREQRDAIAVAKLSSSGQLDPAFGNQGRARFELARAYHKAVAVFPQPSGAVLAVQPTGTVLALVKLTPAGGFDVSFGDGGVTNLSASSTGLLPVARDGDGFVTPSTGFGFTLTRYTAAGVRDTTFGVNGFLSSDALRDLRADGVLATGDGGFIIAGHNNGAFVRGVAVARLSRTDGGLDLAIGGRDGLLALTDTNSTVKSLAELSDGALRLHLRLNAADWLAGVAATGGIDRRLVRDGGTVTPPTFVSGPLFEVKPGVLGIPTVFIDQSSDPELGNTDLAVALVLPDGGLDPAGPNGGFVVAHRPNTSIGPYYAATRQSDGKLVIAGQESTRTTSVPIVCRVNAP